MRKLFFITLALVATVPSFSQLSKKEKRDERKQRVNALIKQEEEGVIAYHKHTAFGFKLTNDGYGGFLEIGRARSVKKVTLFQLDISERKHSKEDKQTNISLPTSPFIFGKINYMYPVKLGVQQQVLLGNKTNRNGVSVTANFGGGVSLALLRPYNLEVNDLNKGNRKRIRYESNDSTLTSGSGGSAGNYTADSTLFTSGNMLSFLQVAGSGLGKGWGQIKVTPGLYAKVSLRFDYGQYNEMLNAIEVGLVGELYSKNIPQMVYVKPTKYFASIYVSIMFGRRK